MLKKTRPKHNHPYFVIMLVAVFSCGTTTSNLGQEKLSHESGADAVQSDSTINTLSAAALSLTQDMVTYDPSYYRLDYPGGDVPHNVGVCTDVVIRAYRKLDIDLQALIHEDMEAHFELYPDHWGLESTDSNIDHRRVPNLMAFFSRFGESIASNGLAENYLTGDIVCWRLSGGMTHIGIVVDRYSKTGRPMIVHNIGSGQVLQDCLFEYEEIGHYRYRRE